MLDFHNRPAESLSAVAVQHLSLPSGSVPNAAVRRSTGMVPFGATVCLSQSVRILALKPPRFLKGIGSKSCNITACPSSAFCAAAFRCTLLLMSLGAAAVIAAVAREQQQGKLRDFMYADKTCKTSVWNLKGSYTKCRKPKEFLGLREAIGILRIP